jgi:hypothetical protein
MINTGCYGDIWTWIHDEDIHNKVFQVILKDKYADPEVIYCYFSQFIELPDGDFLIGLQRTNENYPDGKNTSIFYERMSNMHICYVDPEG